MPTITATFSEPIDSETITTTSFTVDGLTGNVYYDEQLRTAYFIPSIALAHSTTYTARLSTGIRDKVGNQMASEYTWQFTTENPANITVTLPDNADGVNFGEVVVDSTSEEKIVNISSTGTEDLELGTITVTGDDSGEFRITDDNCSGETLVQFQNCVVKVVFEPLSMGDKSAYLSIPSNDTDEEMVDVTLSGVCVAETFWPALYDEMWSVDREGNLSTLRSFRDDVLAQSEMGQKYISALYSNSIEVAVLLISNPSLLIQTREVISALMPDIQSLLAGEEMSVSQDQLDTIEELLDMFETKASPGFKMEIMKARKDISRGDVFNQLGIVVNE